MPDEPAAAPSEDKPPRGVQPWARLDQALPWLMAGWAPFGVLALPLDETFHVPNGWPLTWLLAALVLLWSALAATAALRAIRHARQTQGLPVAAWAAVPVLLLLTAPVALAMLAENDYTEAEDEVCSPGLVPEEIPQALFGWIPWLAYIALPTVLALAGLGFLAKASTRRPGAWILASALMTVSLWMAASAIVNNHCD